MSLPTPCSPNSLLLSGYSSTTPSQRESIPIILRWILELTFSVRRLATAQISLIHHIKTLIANRGAEIQAERSGLGKGEKIRPPTDVLGAIVASQMDIEEEAKLSAGQQVNAGLTPSEIIGNVCESCLAYRYKGLS